MSKEYTTDNIYIDGYLSDGSGSGTSGQVLSSTGGGVSWVDGSGTIIGGPYLPLSAGSSYPLTGDLYQTLGTIGVAQADGDYIAKIYELNSDGFLSLYTGQPTPLERIHISSYGNSWFNAVGGNVGIGTTSPDYTLEVEGASATAISINTPWVSGAYGQLRFQTGTGNSSIRSNVPGNSTNGLDFYTYSAGESVKMTILGGGNIGIGTTSPQAKLHILNSAVGGNYYGQLVVEHAGEAAIQLKGTSFSSIYFSDTAAPYQAGIVYNHSTNNLELRGSGNTDDLTITSAGNVGIGTDNPGVKLEIASGTGGGSAPDSRTLLHIDKDGEAYISINSPAGSFNGIRLNVAGTPKAFMELYDDATQGKKLNIGTVDARDLVFDTGNQPKMTILSGGNVGIGTTGPTRKLHIVSGATNALSLDSTEQYMMEFAKGGVSKYWFKVTSNDSFQLHKNGTGDFITVLSSGNVGIGTTSPGYKLDVTGDARFGDGNNFNPLIQYAGSGRAAGSPGYSFVGDLDTGMFNPNLGNTLAFATGASERMRIDSSGNVGIGITSNINAPLTIQANSGGTSVNLVARTAGQTSTIRFYNDDATTQTAWIGGSNTDFNINSISALPITFNTDNTQRMVISSAGAIKFNAYDSTNNIGTPTYILGTDASGNVVKTNTSNTPVGSNIYTLPSTGGSTAWKLLGRFTAGHGGNSIFIKIVTNTGYNATVDQNSEAYIRFKTSNGGSVDGNGFSGDSSFYTIGANTGLVGSNVKWVSNAAGTSATSYELYINMGSYSGLGGFYSVENTVGTWTPLNNAATDPGAASSTIMIPVKQFKVGGSDLVVGAGGANSYFANSNVGIGVTSPSGRLDVQGGEVMFSINTANKDTFLFTTGAADKGILNIKDDTTIKVKLNTNGDSYLNGGNVGIGTTTFGNFSTAKELIIKGDAVNTNAVLQTISNDGGSSLAIYAGGSSTDDPAIIYQNDLRFGSATDVGLGGYAERMRIDSSGNVGIGTTAFNNYWSGYAVLKLGADNGFFSNIASGTGSALFIAQNVYNDGNIYRHVRSNESGLVDMRDGKFSFLTSPSGSAGQAATMTNRFTILQGGNVGIGTTSPDNKLTIADSTTIYTGKQWGLDFQDTGKGEPQAFVYAEGQYNTNYNTDLLFGTIGASGSATERMRIDSAGNVGIGTTTPAFTSGSGLAIHNDSIPRLKLSNSTSGQGATDGFELLLGGVDAYVYNYEGGSLILGTSATERMRIDSTGNVGIGTTSPSYKLEVNGGTTLVGGGFHVSTDQTIITSSSYTFRDGVYINNPNSSSAAASSTTVMSIGAMTSGTSLITTGNVGIGTTSPAAKLDVQSSVTGNLVSRVYNSNTGTSSSATFRIASAANNANSARLEFSDSAYYTATISGDRAQGLVFRTSATGTNPTTIPERMRITSGGNVGIGTTAPRADSFTRGLTIGNNTDGAAQLVLQENTLAGGWRIFNNGYLGFIANNNEAMRIESDATVYVKGQNSGVDGTIRIGERAYIEHRDAGQTITSIISNYNSNTAKINFKMKGVSDANAQMTILGGGNVGIGTTTPSTKLQVNGRIKADEGVQVGNETSTTASLALVGTLRYRGAIASGLNTVSVVEMCMQTGSSTFAWKAIYTTPSW